MSGDHGDDSAQVQVDEAAQALRRGEVVAFPTETVYGLGACIDRPQAVARIFELKARPHFDPLIVHLASPEQLAQVWTHVPWAASRLAQRFWPGPLTLLGERSRSVPDLVTAGLNTVAVRVPDHPMAQALLTQAQVPVAAPSANRFGGLSPTTAEAVRQELGPELRVLDGGPCRIGVESTVLSLLGDRPTLLRPGGVTAERLQDELGDLWVPPPQVEQALSPGRLPHHYAPSTPMMWLTQLPSGPDYGWLCYREPPAGREGPGEILSPSGSLSEAATRLFAALRRLDARGLKAIGVEPVPETGLGRAIMDRLRRGMAS